MQQIMDATEKEAVDDTMDNIKKMVGEIPYLQMPNHEERAEETSEHIETDAEIDGSLRSHFQEMLSEDSDTRYGMPDENGTGELQSGGQMSIEAVLSGWEKTRRAAQAALQRAQQQKLESAKARAMREAEDIMDRLADVEFLDGFLNNRDPNRSFLPGIHFFQAVPALPKRTVFIFLRF